MRLILIVAALALASPAFSQQAPLDSAFLQRAIAAVQTQRNVALDSAAVAEAKVSGLTEELAKANARIKELEAKPEEKK